MRISILFFAMASVSFRALTFAGDGGTGDPRWKFSFDLEDVNCGDILNGPVGSMITISGFTVLTAEEQGTQSMVQGVEVSSPADSQDNLHFADVTSPLFSDFTLAEVSARIFRPQIKHSITSLPI